MNIRKPVDYSVMYETLDWLMASELPQVELYFEIGRAVSVRPEKGAAVMAAEYLQANYPAAKGFSPRNLRRMREFYRAYASCPELLELALGLGWTQNVVILEAELASEERVWYLHAADQRNWSKGELLEQISMCTHLEISLDSTGAVCYTGQEETVQECGGQNDEDTFCMSWEYLQESNGRVCDEGLGGKGGTGGAIPHRVGCDEHGGDWKSRLSSSPEKACRARDLLPRSHRPPAPNRRLRRIRPAHRDGSGQPPQYVPHLAAGTFLGRCIS